MTRKTYTAADMPQTITADGQVFYRTRYTGTTLPGAQRYFKRPVPAGTPTFEYWHRERGDAVRLQAISPTEFWID